ncbi:hypothetical protein KCP77_23610 [Salmonella enterica subsp. enterica]|nr:hypothetical protein KCP77_23610 [Salmonella enterica subsp. enterica]
MTKILPFPGYPALSSSFGGVARASARPARILVMPLFQLQGHYPFSQQLSGYRENIAYYRFKIAAAKNSRTEYQR